MVLIFLIYNPESGMLYDFALLPRGSPVDLFNVAIEVTLIGKTGISGCSGKGFTGGNHFTGFSYTGLDEVGVRRQTGLFSVFHVETAWLTISAPSSDGQIVKTLDSILCIQDADGTLVRRAVLLAFSTFMALSLLSSRKIIVAFSEFKPLHNRYEVSLK